MRGRFAVSAVAARWTAMQLRALTEAAAREAARLVRACDMEDAALHAAVSALQARADALVLQVRSVQAAVAANIPPDAA
jgi:hypothetical protein